MLETYPNLLEVEFNSNKFNNAILIAFQALNPQTQKFHVQKCHVNSKILRWIGTRLPNLVDLTFSLAVNNIGERIYMQRGKEEDMVHLSGLRHLRHLHGDPDMLYSTVIEDLADNNIPIEDLTIYGSSDTRIVGSVSRLKSIQKLTWIASSYAMVIDVVEKLPALKDLVINGCKHISMHGVKRILEHGTNLKLLWVTDHDILIDSDSLIDSILELARERVRVIMQIKSHNVHISPESYHRLRSGADRRWLFIMGC